VDTSPATGDRTVGQGESSDFYNVNPDGSYAWPDNLGFVGDPVENVLEKGTILDRFGEPSGSFMSPADNTFEQRALGPGEGERVYYQYEVIKPLPVLEGEIAPAFGKDGGGIQILPNFDERVNIEWLLKEKYLKKVE